MLPLLGIARGKGLCCRCEVLPIVQVYVTIVRYCPEYRSMLPLLGIARGKGLCYRCEVLPIVQVYVTIVRYCP